MPRQKLG